MPSFCPSLIWSSPCEVVWHGAQQRSEQMGSSLCVSVSSSQPTRRGWDSSLMLREGSSPCCSWGAPQVGEKCLTGTQPVWPRSPALHSSSSSRSSPWKGALGSMAPLQVEDWPFSWLWIAPLHIGVDYIPCHFDFSLIAMLNSFLYSAFTESMLAHIFKEVRPWQW